MNTINGVEFTHEQTVEMLTELVTEAMDKASARGHYSELGLVYHFLDDRHLIPNGTEARS